MEATAQIFLSYAREDEEKVENLYQKLSDAGFKPWMDKKDILPGERWKSSIQKAIRRSNFFLACLSANSVSKRGVIQKEVRYALDIWQGMLDSDIYLIPVRLADCEVPESLRDFQWVNLFEEDGWTRLVKAIQVGMERREVPADEEPSPGTEMATPKGPERVPGIYAGEEFHAIPKPPHRQVVYFVPRHDAKGRDLVKTMAKELSSPFLPQSPLWGLRGLTKIIAKATRHGPQRGGIVTVWGPGGVGKTTLALEIVQHVYPSPFTGGVIWISAKWRENFSLAFLIKEICTQFGRKEVDRALARLLLGKIPCLLVIDDFETISNSNRKGIDEFITNVPRHCRVLIISRDRQHIGDGLTFPVGTMSSKEAKEFLQSQIESSPERKKLEKLDQAQVMEAADYNLTVMRWILTQVEDGLLLDDILAELAGGKGEAAEQICGLSYERLPRDGREAFLALSLFAPTADREALVATCDFHNGISRVNTALKHLTRLALVESDDYNKRFGLTGLTRDWAQAQLNKKGEKKKELTLRFIAYFLAYAERYSDMRAKSAEALKAEMGNIMRAWDYSGEIGDWQSAERFKDVITTIVLQLNLEVSTRLQNVD